MAQRRINFSNRKLETLLCALTAIALLGGCLSEPNETLSAAQAEEILYKGETPIARVGASHIYQSDVIRAAKAQQRMEDSDELAPESALFSEILEELIDQRLLKLAALKAGTDKDVEVQRRLAEARERTLATYLVENRLKDSVTEESLREMYRSQSALRQNANEANVRLIRVETEEEIRAVAAKLEAGEDFGVLAAALSTERVSQNNNGSLGFVSRVMLPDGLASAVFSVKAGERSAPFETDEGWHIVEVVSFRKPQQPSFEAMREQLRQFKTYAEVQKLMTELRANGDIKVYNKSPQLRGEIEAAPDALTEKGNADE